MEYTILGEKRDIALVHTDEVVLRDAASALEFMMSAQYETGCRKLILPKACVAEAFFSLRTGLAGEILQKFVNYQMRLAIVGEYDHYTSKPLQDFIRESNRGRPRQALRNASWASSAPSSGFPARRRHRL